jgi:hypothetical protein
LELAGDSAINSSRNVILPEDIKTSIRNDDVLDWIGNHTPLPPDPDRQPISSDPEEKPQTLSTSKTPNAVYEAVRACNLERLESIVKAGADLNQHDEGNTALHYLVLNMKGIDIPDLNNMVTTLLKCGIDINAQNKKGETALHICTKYEFLETFSERLSSFYLYVA